MALSKKISRSSFRVQFSEFWLLLLADWAVADPRGPVGPLDGLHRLVDGVPRRVDLCFVQRVDVARESRVGRCQNPSRTGEPGPVKRFDRFRRPEKDGRREETARSGLDEVPPYSTGGVDVVDPVDGRVMAADPALPAPGVESRTHDGRMGLRVSDAPVRVEASSLRL